MIEVFLSTKVKVAEKANIIIEKRWLLVAMYSLLHGRIKQQTLPCART